MRKQSIQRTVALLGATTALSFGFLGGTVPAHADAAAPAEASSHLNAAAYRGFNLLIADRLDAFCLRHAVTPPRRTRPHVNHSRHISP